MAKYQIHFSDGNDRWHPWTPTGKSKPRDWGSRRQAVAEMETYFPITCKLVPAQVKVVRIYDPENDIRSGQDRNDKYALSHTYMETDAGLLPMCGYGWNRSNGMRFSIFRGSPGTQGDCKFCLRYVANRMWPKYPHGFPHKTKWL